MSLSEDEKDWIGEICTTGESCPIDGYWEQIETGRIDKHEKGDKFPELTPAPNYKRASYKYLGRTL